MKCLRMAMCLSAIFGLFLLPKFSFAASSSLVIDEFQIAGESSYDEYVAIGNHGTTSINLNGYKLVKRAKSTTNYGIYDFGDFTLASHQKIVIGHSKFTGIKDFTYSYNGSSNTLAPSNSIYLLAPDKSTIDLVGYGDAAYFEGTPLANPAAGEIYSRTDGIDTDNNLVDFTSSIVAPTIDPNADKIVISEILPNPSEGSEWFELYNGTNQDVKMTSLKICDGMGSTHCYFFPDTEVISAGKYKTFSQTVTKITLNDTGDWLEIRDTNDNVLTDSGGNYGSADDGISLSLFGDEYQWTKTPTPGVQNIYTDTIEIEIKTPTVTKTSTSKTIKTSKKKLASNIEPTVSQADKETSTTTSAAVTEVKAAETESSTSKDPKIGKKEIGWSILVLAVIILVGYFGYEQKERINEIYHKFKR